MTYRELVDAVREIAGEGWFSVNVKTVRMNEFSPAITEYRCDAVFGYGKWSPTPELAIQSLKDNLAGREPHDQLGDIT